MRSFTPKEIIAVLLANGFVLTRSKGSHQIFANAEKGLKTVVPMHHKDLKKGTLHSILKQADIDPDTL
ncbi:mRNA interferase HicA [Mucilaginibacter gracilis]|uniref:mRNA interferase HicA n=1 Tax=Mucilaginibacter gracilis TaxID=423350 RepID=A0A495IXV0_9SPHI|nr:type II toxin-antitoxin system HicA family toxin [Mucilaginibacter gracilis]RKR81323.1 mRNA interferase HicA [Mucilaginibacter gracilis]